MLYKTLAIGLAASTAAQKVGTLKAENHPSLGFSTCTTADGCTSASKEVVIDSNWRWVHQTGQPVNCYDGNMWSETLCPDVETCASNCALEGADEEYEETYGVKAEGDSLDLNFVTKGPYASNVGSRTYLMDDEESYYMFKLKNKEFTFDVDVSQLPCGLNGALYIVAMDKDGGKSKFEKNEAGAKYGTGYCDAQCPHDLKFINGEPNMLDWQPSATDPNAGKGKYGTCCVEMDIWEANSISTAYTAHSCDVQEQTRCEGVQCGDNPDHRFDGACDKNGCDFQTHRLGNSTFYGPGANFGLDSTKKMTVVTQFVTADGTDAGKLTEIRRFYKQGDVVIETPKMAVGGKGSYDSLSTDYCSAWANYTDDRTNFIDKGGMDSMEDAFDKGMVLVMSIWDDHDVNMLWLDSTYPTDGKQPGSARGSCSIDSGVPSKVEKDSPNSHVTFSNIRFGEIGSTTGAAPTPTPPPSPSPSPTPSGCPGGSLQSCINMCPSDPAAAYQACVTTCVSRCTGELQASFLAASATDGSAAPWGHCTTSAACPTGWECTQHEERAAFKQCTPKTALTQAFLATKPDAHAVEEFVRKGTTHFAASGLPH